MEREKTFTWESYVNGQWVPTAENINLLPGPIRQFVHDLETRCDPAGDIQTLASLREQLAASMQLAKAELLNTPVLHEFSEGVTLEALHQRERWGSQHDAEKKPEDWFWLVGYLAGKCLRAHMEGDREKALHHTISTAAALANWHATLLLIDGKHQDAQVVG